MKVRVLIGFTHVMPDDRWIVGSPGQVLEMPEGADWIRAGLAEALPEIETAMIKPTERAVSKRGGRTSPKKGK